jgi:hypothetical protein
MLFYATMSMAVAVLKVVGIITKQKLEKPGTGG